ncbi:MAG: hypothetical protein ABSD62_13970 [Candidatus Limnocylindrales bacterium]|jgi:hypothetical protein
MADGGRPVISTESAHLDWRELALGAVLSPGERADLGSRTLGVGMDELDMDYFSACAGASA